MSDDWWESTPIVDWSCSEWKSVLAFAVKQCLGSGFHFSVEFLVCHRGKRKCSVIDQAKELASPPPSLCVLCQRKMEVWLTCSPVQWEADCLARRKCKQEVRGSDILQLYSCSYWLGRRTDGGETEVRGRDQNDLLTAGHMRLGVEERTEMRARLWKIKGVKAYKHDLVEWDED